MSIDSNQDDVKLIIEEGGKAVIVAEEENSPVSVRDSDTSEHFQRLQFLEEKCMRLEEDKSNLVKKYDERCRMQEEEIHSLRRLLNRRRRDTNTQDQNEGKTDESDSTLSDEVEGQSDSNDNKCSTVNTSIVKCDGNCSLKGVVEFLAKKLEQGLSKYILSYIYIIQNYFVHLQWNGRIC